MVAPLKLGVDFAINPFETLGRSATGIHNMFDRAGASIAGQRSNRDSIADSLLGVSDAQRELAVELGVDPYTDFPPLAQRLRQMAGAMAGGQMTVKAALVAVTGGVGIGLSAASNVEGARDTLREKTAAQVIVEVKTILIALEIPEDLLNRLVENRSYTPAELLIMARARTTQSAEHGRIYRRRGRRSDAGRGIFPSAAGRASGGAKHRTWRSRSLHRRCRTRGERHARPPGRRALPVRRPRMDRSAAAHLPGSQRRASPTRFGRRRGVRNDRAGDADGRRGDQETRLDRRSTQAGSLSGPAPASPSTLTLQSRALRPGRRRQEHDLVLG